MPAFDEAGKVAGTLGELRAALAGVPGGHEILVSDDGSSDATAAEVEAVAASDPRVRLVRNPCKGRGAALRSGLAAASGEIVVTVDVDLSYGPGDVLRLFEHLKRYPGCDLVLGSCYMLGGEVEGVPARRLWVSKIGNLLLRFAFNGRFRTTTCILRGYRRETLQALLPTLVSDGKELYLEILHKALAAGWSVEEIPATLTWRRTGGGGGFFFLPTAWSHLSFLLARRIGLVLCVVAVLQVFPWVVAFAGSYADSRNMDAAWNDREDLIHVLFPRWICLMYWALSFCLGGVTAASVLAWRRPLSFGQES